MLGPIVTMMLYGCLLLPALLIIRRNFLRMKVRSRNGKPFEIAFFHPNCMAGGGGEKVLWHAIKSLQDNPINDKIVVTVLAASTCPAEDKVLEHVRDRFDLTIDKPIRILRIKTHELCDARHYRILTMLAQSLGSMLVAIECSFRCDRSDVIVDTTGFAFTYPVFALLTGVQTIIAYVHYPTISDLMIARNNNGIRKFYYRMISSAYRWCGSFCNLTMANSTWTKRHIETQWNCESVLIYPPCDCELPDKYGDHQKRLEPPVIISVAQFRPEKNLKMAIEVMDRLLMRFPEYKGRLRLLLVGSCRNAEDKERLGELINMTYRKKMSLDMTTDPEVDLSRDTTTSVWFACGISADKLKAVVRASSMAIHTMIDEHFGIAVAEALAAGLIMIAHKSAGPFEDIVSNDCGFCVEKVDEYVDKIVEVLNMDLESRIRMRENAVKRALKFDCAKFRESFFEAVHFVTRFGQNH